MQSKHLEAAEMDCYYFFFNSLLEEALLTKLFFSHVKLLTTQGFPTGKGYDPMWDMTLAACGTMFVPLSICCLFKGWCPGQLRREQRKKLSSLEMILLVQLFSRTVLPVLNQIFIGIRTLTCFYFFHRPIQF